MAIAAGTVLAFGTVVLGFSFSVVFTVHQDKGSLIRFFSGRDFAGHFVARRHALSRHVQWFDSDALACHWTSQLHLAQKMNSFLALR